MRKRRGVQHWLGNLPNQLSPERLLRYYNFLRYSKVQWNRQLAAKRIVMSHVRLGMSLVANKTEYFPDKTDLLVAEMLYILTDGVSRLERGAIDHHDEPNITGYLVTVIKGHLNKAVAKDISKIISLHDIAVEKGDASELMELILSVAVEPMEAALVRMRAEGYKDDEIAQCLGSTQQHIQRLRARLRDKVMELLG